jgi:hypothetical protein
MGSNNAYQSNQLRQAIYQDVGINYGGNECPALIYKK